MTFPPLPRFPQDFPLGPKQIERLLFQIPRSATYETGGLADICQALLLDRAVQLVGVENVRWDAALNRWMINAPPAARFGDPGVRDPEHPCVLFSPGLALINHAGCETDGHALCAECERSVPQALLNSESKSG